MATESFFEDLIIDTPEAYANYLRAMQSAGRIQVYDFSAELRRGEEFLKKIAAEDQALPSEKPI